MGDVLWDAGCDNDLLTATESKNPIPAAISRRL